MTEYTISKEACLALETEVTDTVPHRNKKKSATISHAEILWWL